MLLPPALGFSPHPPVSVYGTGVRQFIAAFPRTRLLLFPTLFRSPSRPRLPQGVLPPRRLLRLGRALLSRLAPTACVPTFLLPYSTGISTCCPSAAHLCLALGPDFPGADQLYPGILGYSAWRIPTSISLLIPAFSLPVRPHALTAMLPPTQGCSSTNVLKHS